MINPNTSISMTESLKPAVAVLALPGISINYWTNDVDGPAYTAIANAAQLKETTDQYFPRIQEMAEEYDGFLLACYAEHPLVPLLQSSLAPKPVIGIFEASMTVALHTTMPDSQFVIMTTGKPFEKMLTDAVRRFLGVADNAPHPTMFGGVVATEIVYGESDNNEIAKEKILNATKQLLGRGNITIICLGGVILMSMNEYVREAWAQGLVKKQPSD